MKNPFKVISPLLLAAYLLITHYDVPVNGFVKDLLLGISLGGGLYTFLRGGRRSHSRS